MCMYVYICTCILYLSTINKKGLWMPWAHPHACMKNYRYTRVGAHDIMLLFCQICSRALIYTKAPNLTRFHCEDIHFILFNTTSSGRNSYYMSYLKFHYENKGTIYWQNSAYMYVPIVNFPRSTIRCTPSYDFFLL